MNSIRSKAKGIRQRRAILRALQDPDVLALMESARHEMPELNRHYDREGLNVAIPQGLRKWVWIARDSKYREVSRYV